MPMMSGIELATIVRTMQQKGELSQETKLVLTSGDDYSQELTIMHLYDSHLMKPVSFQKLN